MLEVLIGLSFFFACIPVYVIGSSPRRLEIPNSMVEAFNVIRYSLTTTVPARYKRFGDIYLNGRDAGVRAASMDIVHRGDVDPRWDIRGHWTAVTSLPRRQFEAWREGYEDGLLVGDRKREAERQRVEELRKINGRYCDYRDALKELRSEYDMV